jgi:hypothetical protein
MLDTPIHPPKPARYRQLTLGLISVLLVPPFLKPVFPRANLVGALVFIVLVARVARANGESRVFRLALATAVMSVALRAVSTGAVWQSLGGFGLAQRLVTALGFTYVVIALLRRVLEAGPVDAEKLFGAVAAYLMIGLAFASVYEAIAHWKPAAFTFPNGDAADTDGLFYFSLVTLSTVGYGDVVPNLPEARVLAVLEAILGQLYLAILMARLVGLHLNQSNTGLEFGSTPIDSQDKPPPRAPEAP